MLPSGADIATSHATHDGAMAIRILGHPLVPTSRITFSFAVAVLLAAEINRSGDARRLVNRRRLRVVSQFEIFAWRDL